MKDYIYFNPKFITYNNEYQTTEYIKHYYPNLLLNYNNKYYSLYHNVYNHYNTITYNYQPIIY